MSSLSLSTPYIDVFLAGHDFPVGISVQDAHLFLQNKTCKGAELLGWIDLPIAMTDDIIAEIQATAWMIQSKSDVLIVCGIGGSYLGARAVIESLKIPPTPLYQGGIEIVFLGNHLSGLEYEKVFAKYAEKRVSACVISKSGTTLETAISYRLVRNFLLTKYSPEEVKERIITITDETHGALRMETTKKGYKSYALPGNIGGRYSVLTAVGLLPIAVAGVDIQALIEGAREAQKEIQNKGDSIVTPAEAGVHREGSGWIPAYAGMTDKGHPAFLYAEKRVHLEQSGFVSELFITSEPSLYFIGEWWKQLFGESQGKEGKGLYPDTLSYTTDLHSLGQYVQEGRRLFFETMLWIQNPSSDLKIPALSDMTDGLDPLVGRSLHEMNLIALESTAKAHNDGGCPSMMMILEKLDAQNLGYFLYTMMYACALSGIMIGVNPFDQPGVEAYKREMRERMK